MTDDELRRLERSWRRTQSEADRSRWLTAWARARTPAPEWTEFVDSHAGYDPERVRRAASELLAARIDATQGGYRSPVYTELNALVRQEAGLWFPGLSEEWAPPWCPCHCLPKTAAGIGEGVDKILAQLTGVYAYHGELIALGEAEPPSCEPQVLLVQLSQLASQAIELTVEATGCNDAWYREVGRAIRLVLLGRGIELDDDTRRAIANLVSTHFTSWIGPDDANRGLVADGAAELAVEALFREGPLREG